MFKSSTYTDIMQKPVLNFLMNTQGQSSLFEYPLFRRNSFSRLYHILPDCFKSYKDLTSFIQYMLRFAFVYGTEIQLGTFIYIYPNLMTHINMQSRHPSTAKIYAFILLEILDIRKLFHSLLDNMFR
jgi:hypothetical protein